MAIEYRKFGEIPKSPAIAKKDREDDERKQAIIEAIGKNPENPSRKKMISIHLSPEVIEFFKSTGRDWQPKINALLLSYVRRKKQGPDLD